MVFSDTSNLTGLVEDVDFLCGTDSTSYPLKDKARNINRWYYDSVISVWKSSNDWEFDDANQTGFPIATTTLVNSQADYTIPTNALRVLRIEVLDQSGIWHVVNPIDEVSIDTALNEFYKTDGLPKLYRLTRRNIVLYPAPDNGVSVTLSAGLKIYFLREVDEFVSTDTTQEPGIAEPFHRILSLGAAYDYTLVNGVSDKAQAFRAEIERSMQQMREFYATRHRNYKVKLRPKVEKYE